MDTGELAHNGRVNLSAGESGIDAIGDGRRANNFQVPGFGYEREAETNFQADMLRGNLERNPLSDAFFSPNNVKTIQNNIRRYVYEKSHPKGYVIDEQSSDELKIIMRAMYYQYAKHGKHDIAGQVNELNNYVINWSGPHILSAVDHYFYYLKDIDTLPVPMAQPVHLSSAGNKSLSMMQPFM
jgi:hypothetical protein